MPLNLIKKKKVLEILLKLKSKAADTTHIFCWIQLSVSLWCRERRGEKNTKCYIPTAVFPSFNSWSLNLSAVVRYHYCATRRTEQCSQVEPAVIRPWREMMDTQSSHRQFTPGEKIHSLPLSTPSWTAASPQLHQASRMLKPHNRLTQLQVITSFHVLVFFSPLPAFSRLSHHVMPRYLLVFSLAFPFCNISVFSCHPLFALPHFCVLSHLSFHLAGG